MNLNLSLDEMTKAGMQFGHRKSKIHPKMKPYIYGVRNTIFIIDLEKAKEKLEAALKFVDESLSEGKSIMIVGTKTQFKSMVRSFAEETGLPYVSERWLGGTFTNFKIIKKRIDYFKDLEKKKEAGEFEKYTKKERAKIDREIKNLDKRFSGLKNMEKLPDIIFVVHMIKDKLAVKEAKQNGIKVVGITDVDIDPTIADYPIVANDDSISSVAYILEQLKKVTIKQEAKNGEAVPVSAEKEND